MVLSEGGKGAKRPKSVSLGLKLASDPAIVKPAFG
jgi:hypothetical protein